MCSKNICKSVSFPKLSRMFSSFALFHQLPVPLVGDENKWLYLLPPLWVKTMMMCALWVYCTPLCAQLHEGRSLKSTPGSFPEPAFPVHATVWVSVLCGEKVGYVLFLQTAAGKYKLKIIMITFLSSKL